MSLATAIAAFNKKTEKVVGKEFRARCINITNDAIKNTPVDTGRLRANWQLGFGWRPEGEVDFEQVSGPFRSTSDSKAASARLAQGQSSEQVGASANSLVAKVATVAYITNNLPYAQAVENGGPTNRPRRMLQRAIRNAVRNL